MQLTIAALLTALVAGAASELTPAQQDARRAVAVANNDFSVDLYEVLRSKPGNLVVSPFSASAVLALVEQGAGGDTARQLISALHLPSDPAKVRDGYQTLFDGLQTNKEVIVRIANRVYKATGAAIKPEFKQVAENSFRADAQELDFAGDNENSRKAINQWVEQVTDNKIKDLLKTLDPSTIMVLVNAIYFKGTWANIFSEELTRSEPFHTSANSQVNVPMMHRTGEYAYADVPELKARVLELPYRGYSMKMWVLLPNAVDGCAQMEAALNQLNISKIASQMSSDEVIVTLPKFKIESKFELHEKLPQLGIRDLFTPAANLSGITGQHVFVSQAVQKAFVEVTEKGTVAAAATALAVSFHSAVVPAPEPIFFTADHPFLFFIMDKADTIVFMGRVNQP